MSYFKPVIGSLSCLLCFSVSLNSFASRLDPVIVSSKVDNQSSEETSAHSVLDESQIQTNVSTDIIDLLQSIPGVYVSRTGGAGSQISINLRGSDAGHVLVLIDGVNANDPSEGSRKFNMPSIKSLDIERIEVLKGAQSVLYGSNALSGVINIITKKSQSNNGQVAVEFGEEKGISNSLTLYGKKSVFYAHAFYNESEGISAQKAGSEKDGNANKGVTLNYSYAFDKMDIQWQYKLLDSFVEVDKWGADDLGAYNKQIQQIFSQKISAEHGKNKLNQKLSLNKSDRTNKYDNSGSYNIDQYSGSSIDNDVNYLFNLKNKKLLIGISNQFETFKKSKTKEVNSSLHGVYSSLDIKDGMSFYSMGLRNDSHEDFGNFGSFALGLGRNFEGRKQLKLHYSTGFKAPTMYQLYVEQDGSYTPGNKNLKPEKSRSVDLTYRKMGTQSYSISLFDNIVDDKITFSGSTGPYINSGTSRSYGVELSSAQKISNNLNFMESVSLYKYENSSSKHTLKRPTEQVSLKGEYSFSDSHFLVVDWMWVSSRWAYGDELMEAYDLTNIAYRAAWNKYGFKLGVKNLFDREYVEAAGYGTYGTTIYSQLSMSY